jgi:arsenate reductase
MRWLNHVLLLLVVGACTTVSHDGRATDPKGTVLFLCPYGGAKSVIAASYFNRLADERALPYRAIAAAVEEPYAAVPPPVAGLLQREGFDVSQFKPHHVEGRDVKDAVKIVSIDCNSAALDAAIHVEAASVERWNDVPKVSEDLDGSAAAIRRHVETLIEKLRGRH